MQFVQCNVSPPPLSLPPPPPHTLGGDAGDFERVGRVSGLLLMVTWDSMRKKPCARGGLGGGGLAEFRVAFNGNLGLDEEEAMRQGRFGGGGGWPSFGLLLMVTWDSMRKKPCARGGLGGDKTGGRGGGGPVFLCRSQPSQEQRRVEPKPVCKPDPDFAIQLIGKSVRSWCDRIAHTTDFVTPVVEHWLEREIAQWVHLMKDRSDVPSQHERTLLPRSYISLPPPPPQKRRATSPLDPRPMTGPTVSPSPTRWELAHSRI